PPPRFPLFPYTTLFRSPHGDPTRCGGDRSNATCDRSDRRRTPGLTHHCRRVAAATAIETIMPSGSHRQVTCPLCRLTVERTRERSEEHTSELQSHLNLV